MSFLPFFARPLLRNSTETLASQARNYLVLQNRAQVSLHGELLEHHSIPQSSLFFPYKFYTCLNNFTLATGHCEKTHHYSKQEKAMKCLLCNCNEIMMEAIFS